MIIVPPKVYLDTGHLINIADVRKGRSCGLQERDVAYRRIDQCISNGLIVCVFSQAATLDWAEGKASKESVNEIAAVLDRGVLLDYFESDHFLLLAELLDDFRRQHSEYAWPQLPRLQKYKPAEYIQHVTGILANQVPGYWDASELPPVSEIPLVLPTTSVAFRAVHAIRFRDENPDVFQEKRIGFGWMMQEELQAANERGVFSLKKWATGFLRIDRIARHLGLESEIDRLLENVSFEACPGIQLLMNCRKKIIVAQRQPKTGDADDHVFIPLAPYCDVMLTDRAHREAILQGDRSLDKRVFSNPRDAAGEIDRLLGICPTK